MFLGKGSDGHELICLQKQKIIFNVRFVKWEPKCFFFFFLLKISCAFKTYHNLPSVANDLKVSHFPAMKTVKSEKVEESLVLFFS